MGSQTVPSVSPPDSPNLSRASAEDTSETSLSESLVVLRKRRLAVAITLLFALAIGLYKAFTQEKIFDATSKIEVRSGSSQEFKVDPAQVLNGDSTSNKMAAEVVILQSDSVLMAVAREMDLCNKPDFLGVKGPVPYESIEDLSVREKTLHRLHSQLKIQLIPKTDIIRITYSSLNPQMSAEIVNNIVNAYVQRSYETRFQSTARVSGWLSNQLDDLKGKVEKSQKQMLDLQRTLGMLGFDPTKNQNTTALEDLSIAVAQARINRILAEARYREMSSMDPNSIEDSIDPTRGAAPQVLTQLRNEIAAARSTLANLETTLGPNHPQVKAQKAQLESLQKEQDTEQGRLLAQAKENFVIAKASEERILDTLESQKAEAFKMRNDLVEYTLSQREYESNRTLYEGLVQRLRTASIEAGLESMEIDTVDPAVPAAAPTLKPKSTIMITAFIVGALAGVLLAFLLESLDTGLNSIADLEGVTGLPSLAVVPKFKPFGGDAGRVLTTAEQNLYVLSSPKSQFSEALRSLRTSLLLSAGKRPKYLLFTSATPSEGKTTVSTNMACLLAQGGTPVLLIDADMRRPNVHPKFGLTSKIGLSTFLSGGSTFEEVLQRIPEVPSLDIIASGPVPPFPSELLSSPTMTSMIENAKETYEYVIIDSPPVLSVTDGVILAGGADAVVLVVRFGTSSKHIVRRARDVLQRANARITGVVLNAVDLASPEYKSYYGKSAYHYAGSEASSWDAQSDEKKKDAGTKVS